jgi:hypothetical protein
LPDFSWSKHTKSGENIPNDRYLNQMYLNNTKRPKNIPNGHKIKLHSPFQCPPNFTQIGILGMKINHLATLTQTQCKNANGLLVVQSVVCTI